MSSGERKAKMAPALLSTTLSDILTTNMESAAAVCSRCCRSIHSHIRAANANVPPCETRQDQTGSLRPVAPSAYLAWEGGGISHCQMSPKCITWFLPVIGFSWSSEQKHWFLFSATFAQFRSACSDCAQRCKIRRLLRQTCFSRSRLRFGDEWSPHEGGTCGFLSTGCIVMKTWWTSAKRRLQQFNRLRWGSPTDTGFLHLFSAATLDWQLNKTI